jgi:NUMOD3 motif
VRARRLVSRRAAKAPRTRLTKTAKARHGNVTKRLHGRKRVTGAGWGRGKTRVVKHPRRHRLVVARKVAGRRVVSPATRAKIAAALRGKKHPHKGHAMSVSARGKIAAALRGRKHPGRKGVHHKGHPISAQTRAKISAALTGRKHPHRGVPRRKKK